MRAKSFGLADSPGGGDQRFELQMAKTQGRRPGRHRRAADVVGWRARQDLVDDADAVEANHDG
jgi:hypothetical protein